MPPKKRYKNEKEVWEEFEAYRKDTKENPRIIYEFNGKDAVECKRKVERPLTLEGFYNWCRRKNRDVHNYFQNNQGNYDAFKGICRAIRDEIRQDQIEGGMAGQFNPSITQRLNGLKEQTVNDNNHNIELLSFDPLEPGEEPEQDSNNGKKGSKTNTGKGKKKKSD